MKLVLLTMASMYMSAFLQLSKSELICRSIVATAWEKD